MNASRSHDDIFKRGLDPGFEDALLGPLNALLRLVRDQNLDLQIRENYINVYEGRGSVLKLAWAGNTLRATIHREYEPPASLRQPFDLSSSKRWVEQFIEALPGIRQRAGRHDKREGAAEFHVARTNVLPPFVALDRQVQLPGERASRVDLVGLHCAVGCDPSLVLVELKEGASLPVSAVLGQVERYERLYVRGGYLRRDVASSLGRVFDQKVRLGLLPSIPGIQALDAMPVELLVVLSSRGVGIPLRRTWTRVGPPLVHYVGLATGEHAIPDRSRWETLRSAGIG